MRKLLAFVLALVFLFTSAGALCAEVPVGMASFMALATRSSAGKTVVGLNGKVPLFWFDGKTFFICEIETAKTKDGAEYKKPTKKASQSSALHPQKISQKRPSSR